MHHFAYRNGLMHAEDVAVPDLVARYGSPLYVYSSATLRRHVRVIDEAFAPARRLIAYSVKANPNVSVIATVAREGAGADVVSGGELAKALAAGVAPHKIVFSGVGKTRDELAFALKTGIGLFNVESEPELVLLDAVAREQGKIAPIALRVNPDVAAGGHAKISTGKAEDKFGVAWADAMGLYAKAAAMPGVRAEGVDVHIGSQIEALEPFQEAARRVAGLVTDLRAAGHAITRVDLGGGLAIPYQEDAAAPPPPADYARAVRAVLDPLDVEIILEPGRVIAGNAGVLISTVTYVKRGATRDFLIVDAGMNDLLRPALYDAWHDVKPVKDPGPDAKRAPMDVVGPICETGDRFAAQRDLPPVAQSDLVAFMSAGAYGAAQASEYNARPRVAEVLVDGADHALVRERGSVEAMLAAEPPAPWLETEIDGAPAVLPPASALSSGS